MRSNKILNRPLQFGDRDQITWLKQNSKMMAGEMPVCEAEWRPCIYSGRKTFRGQPIIKHCLWKNADAVYCYLDCPKCGCSNKHVVCYDPLNTPIEEWTLIEKQEINCWQCELEMYIDDDGSRNIYVKQTSDSDY